MSKPSLRDNWLWLAAGLALLVLLWMLAPILTPFVLGAALAYVGDPVVDRLERWKLSRTLGVSLVFLAISTASAVALLLLVPMLSRQFIALLHNIPDWLAWVQDVALPRLGIELPAGVRLDADGLRSIVQQHWSKAGDVLAVIWARASASTGAVLTTTANLLLVPIVAFYLLRDWDRLVLWIRGVIPPRMLPTADQLARETDEVLGAFIRGQLSVMAALTVYYWIALWLAGLKLALIVGLIIGLVSFVPYLGTVVGVLAAVIAMVMQTQEPMAFVWLAVVFGIGQFLESNVLTPLLVGDRIGLHPVAVMFAVMAGGQLFGFIGVLAALPVAAVIAVMLRHAHRHWLQSPLYGRDAEGQPRPEASVPVACADDRSPPP